MGVVHEYFTVTPAELAELDLARSPSGQVSTDRAVGLADIDPDAVLGLVALLAVEDVGELRDQEGGYVLFDGDGSGPWLVELDWLAVETIQGADGDPEMEWEDTAERWATLLAAGSGAALDPQDLLAASTELRRLAGMASGDQRLYCWTPSGAYTGESYSELP